MESDRASARRNDGQCPPVGKPIKYKRMENVSLKQLANHALSAEQQLFYKEITLACVGFDETKRMEALQSLTTDPGLNTMMPQLIAFIAEGVRVNVMQHNMAVLIYLMRMIKALLDNNTALLDTYLHEIIPSVATCVVCNQLCLRPEEDNHWALRDFGSRLIARMCKKYSSSTNNIQPRMIRVYQRALTDETLTLSTVYGGVSGLGELGSNVVRMDIIPKLKDIGTRLDSIIDGIDQTQADMLAILKIKRLIARTVCSLLIVPKTRTLEEFKKDYGYLLGECLHSGVLELEKQAFRAVFGFDGTGKPLKTYQRQQKPQ